MSGKFSPELKKTLKIGTEGRKGPGPVGLSGMQFWLIMSSETGQSGIPER